MIRFNKIIMENAKILIVEDEAIIAMETESQLQSLGYEVTSIVNNGEDAIKKTESDKPDLILMDIRIKGEMDGIETAEVIRNKFGIPVIFLTAYADEERLNRAKLTQPFGYLLKPIQERELKVTIAMALYVVKVDAERKKVEESFKKSEHRLSTHIEFTPLGVMEFDATYKVTSWNPACEKIFGYSQDEIIGKIVFDCINVKGNDDAIYMLFDRILKGEKVENTNDNLTKDGKIITCKWFNTRLENEKGEVIGGASFCQDITNQIQADKTLKESERLLRKVSENYPSFLSIIEKDYTVGYSAGLPFKKLNLNPDEFNGQTLEQVFGKLAPIVKKHYQEAFEGNEVRFELEFEGNSQYYRVIPIVNEEGTVDKLLAVVDNLT
jgi:PAS domain S-box-containing protein